MEHMRAATTLTKLLRSMPAKRTLKTQIVSAVDEQWKAVFGGLDDRSRCWSALSPIVPKSDNSSGLQELEIITLPRLSDHLRYSELIPFVQRHKPTLKTLKLQIPVLGKWNTLDDVAGEMRLFLEMARNDLALQSLQCWVPKLGCDVACNLAMGGTHDRRCLRYHTGG